MKDCTNTNAFRNLEHKIRRHRTDDMHGSDIEMALLDYIGTLEGQILQLNKRIEELEKVGDDGK